jgi:Spy/CpxP family protein refolding chaperone
LSAPLPTSGESSPLQSPYAGQEGGTIKALSPEDILALARGEGMGHAKAAELNRYPGPRHVLDLAKALELTDAQREQAERIFSAMHGEAVRLGQQILAVERKMDEGFRTEAITEADLMTMTAALGQFNGQLRADHLRAHLQLHAILTAEQVERYQHLRGYRTPAEGHSPSSGVLHHRSM